MLQLIIPARNEAGRLPTTFARLREHLDRTPVDFGGVELIVVDNASTDGTRAVALAANSPALPIRVVTCPTPGKGAAVRAGVLCTTAELVGFMDADGATGLDALDEAWRRVTLGADVAVASRAVAGSVTQVRHSALRARGATLYRRLAGRIVPGIADTQCGLKLFRGNLARTVFAELRTTGFSFDVEVLARARTHRASLTEFPVHWEDIPGSTFQPIRHGAGSFLDLALISLALRRADARRTVVSPLRPSPTMAPSPVESLEVLADS